MNPAMMPPARNDSHSSEYPYFEPIFEKSDRLPGPIMTAPTMNAGPARFRMSLSFSAVPPTTLSVGR